MSPWLERYRPASFRGVPFVVENAGSEFGRRVARHDYVRRELPYFEDLGRKAREWKVEGLVVGDDFLEQRDRIIAAAETAGPGELVHPYHGTMRVVCLAVTVGHSTGEGRIARLSFSFAEAGAASFPAASKVATAAVESAAAALELAAAATFDSKIVADNVPAFVPAAALTSWQKIQKAIEDLDLAGKSAAVAALRDKLAGVADGFIAKLAHPSDLASDVQDLYRSIESAAGSRLAAVRVFLGLARIGSPGFPGGSPLQRAAQDNADAVNRLARSSAIAGAGRSASFATFDTYDQAVATREEILDALDELEQDADDETFQELGRLRSEIQDAVPVELDNLPHLDLFTPPSVLPSVVIAYRLYADAQREAEIVDRNHVRHPGFVPPVPLEVKSA